MLNFFKKKIEEVLERNIDELLKKQGVQCVGLGNKITDGKDTGKISIVVFVRTKMPKTMLLREEIVPKKVGGYLTDVIDAGGEIEPVSVHRQKYRPVIGGISTKREGGTACTLGLIVFKENKPHALTNEHCVYFKGQGEPGRKLLQPSPLDGGRMTDAIGTITYPPLIRNDQRNKIDSNIIPLDVDSELKVLGLENYKKQWVKPRIGMSFIKPGRTTGITKGVISHINVLAKVNFRGNLGVCEFFPCIFALQNNFNIVDGGDSGSCIFSSEGVIGQTFAASPNLAIFLTGEIIGQELKITLDRKEPEIGFVAIERRWITDKEVLVNGLNLRREPQIADNIIRKLNKREKIKIIEYAGFNRWHWAKVKLDN